MPTTANPTPITATSGQTESVLVDGDTVNMDDLYKEATPGGTPKLTLYRLRCLIEGITHPGALTRAMPGWILDDPAGTQKMYLDSDSVSADSYAFQRFAPPHGAALSKVTCYCAPGHTPPAGVKVSAEVYRHTINGNTSTQIAATVIDPATGSGYSAAHGFDVPITSGSGAGGTTETVDDSLYTYHVKFIGETGTGKATVLYTGGTYTYTL